MMRSNAERIATVAADMDALGAQFRENPQAKTLLVRDAAKAILIGQGLIVKKWIQSTRVGVHPVNRFGRGVTGARVVKLTAEIEQDGFSPEEVGEPWCADMPPESEPEYNEMRDFNAAQMAASAGLLPPYNRDKIEAQSLTDTHTSQVFRCLELGAPSDHPVLSTDGRLSMEKLQRAQPMWHAAVLKGLEWNCIPWQVCKRFPWLPELWQETGNMTQTVAEVIGEPFGRSMPFAANRNAAARGLLIPHGSPRGDNAD